MLLLFAVCVCVYANNNIHVHVCHTMEDYGSFFYSPLFPSAAQLVGLNVLQLMTDGAAGQYCF